MSNIEKLTYINPRGESIDFSHDSVFFTEKLTGLSMVRNVIHSVSSAGQDGETDIVSRRDSGYIGIYGAIDETDPEILRKYRRQFSRILVQKQRGTLVYEYGDFKRIIDCRVQEGDVFKARDIYMDFIVEFYCPYPFWREEHETRTDVAAWIGTFEFPEPDGLEIPLAGIEVGYREPSLIVPVYNSGYIDTGMRVVFRAIGSVTNPSVLNVNTQQYMILNMEMEAGDVVTVNTGFNKKGITLTRSGVTSNIFRKRAAGWTWLQLAPGDTLIRYDADANIDNLEVTIYHDNFSGV